MDKFQDKYRIGSHRLKGWDYSSNGYYFITIVIQNRESVLGKIENHKMILSDFGEIVQTEFNESFKMRTELFLDEFIVMPNHLHALMVLNRPKITNETDSNVVHSNGTDLNGTDLNVETHGRASLHSNPNQINPNQMNPNQL